MVEGWKSVSESNVISLFLYSEGLLLTTVANTLGLGEPLFWSMPVLIFLSGMCIYYQSNQYATEVLLWRHWIGTIIPFFLLGKVGGMWAQLCFALQSYSKIFNLFSYKKKKNYPFICMPVWYMLYHMVLLLYGKQQKHTCKNLVRSDDRNLI